MSDIFVRSSETWGNNNFTVVSVISRNQDDVNFYLLLIVENSSYVVRYKSTNVGAHLKPSSCRNEEKVNSQLFNQYNRIKILVHILPTVQRKRFGYLDRLIPFQWHLDVIHHILKIPLISTWQQETTQVPKRTNGCSASRASSTNENPKTRKSNPNILLLTTTAPPPVRSPSVAPSVAP